MEMQKGSFSGVIFPMGVILERSKASQGGVESVISTFLHQSQY
jgi:hypothetical protein